MTERRIVIEASPLGRRAYLSIEPRRVDRPATSHPDAEAARHAAEALSLELGWPIDDRTQGAGR